MACRDAKGQPEEAGQRSFPDRKILTIFTNVSLMQQAAGTGAIFFTSLLFLFIHHAILLEAFPVIMSSNKT